MSKSVTFGLVASLALIEFIICIVFFFIHLETNLGEIQYTTNNQTYTIQYEYSEKMRVFVQQIDDRYIYYIKKPGTSGAIASSEYPITIISNKPLN